MFYEVLGDINITWLLLALLMLWEHISPDKALDTIRQRWIVNFLLLFISFAVLEGLNLIFPTLAQTNEVISVFALSESGGWFLLIASLLLLDLFSYLSHRVFHHYQLLWRCHCVHHSDLHVDLSTNFRHHPFELILTWALTISLVWLVEINLIVLALFAAASFVMQMWQHSNIKMNANIDRILSYIMVTPNVHKIHHSSCKALTNSNYGTVLTIWDRLFGTFTPAHNIQAIDYGLEYFRTPSEQSFYAVLTQPFKYYHKRIKSKFIQEL